jgi:hypothetical protein
MKKMSFVLSAVRQQKSGPKNLKGTAICTVFGEEASSYFEPFLRSYIPKLYNESPNIDCEETFKSVLTDRIIRMELLSRKNVEEFLCFGEKNKISRCLYLSYEQHALINASLIYEELKNPSYNGFGHYYYRPLVSMYPLSQSPICVQDVMAQNILVKLHQGKEGPFQSFIHYVYSEFPMFEGDEGPETVKNYIHLMRSSLGGIDPEKKYHELQPLMLLFGFLWRLNDKYSSPEKQFCPFLEWDNFEDVKSFLNHLYCATIFHMIIYQITTRQV